MQLLPRYQQRWNRSPLVRELRALTLWRRTQREGFDLAHLPTLVETTYGPVQRDEAVLLFGLVRCVQPRTLVEFGLDDGHSTFNFLRAMDADARLYSFDINPHCLDVARRRFSDDARHKLLLKPGETFSPEDVDGRTVDFVFIDAGHQLGPSQETFRRLLPVLSPEAMLAVHDTGTLPRRFFVQGHSYLEHHDRWVDDAYEGEPGERAFVNWILDDHPEFSQIHFHSRHVHRAGITLLQRRFRLNRPPGVESEPHGARR